MMPGERLAFVVIFLLISFVADAVIFYVIGYKSGRKDEGIDWAEKEEYYKWLLEMKKRQDFEEVKIVPKKEKPKKDKKQRPTKVVHPEKSVCDICGKVIKKGTLCYECQKAGW